MPRKLNKWTVMIYMAGDNELSNRCVDDLREINRITKADGVKILVQVDRSGEDDTRCYRFPQHKRDPFEELKFTPRREINTGGKYALTRFINYCISQAPAERYMLILWGHARGMDTFSEAAPSREAAERRLRFAAGSRRGRFSRQNQRAEKRKPFFIICPDQHSGQAITNFELREILELTSRRIGRKIDIFGMDACLMGMAEMCYELRESVRYVIGSETLVPGTSWPYHTILQHLVENSDTEPMEPKELCNIIVKAFVAYYAPYDAQDVQLSVLDLERADALVKAVKRLSNLLTPHMVSSDPTHGDMPVKNAVIKSHWEAQSFDEDQYVDLFDFCDVLRQNCHMASGGGTSDIREAAENVMRVLDPRSAAALLGGGPGTDDGFVTTSHWHGDGLEYSYGLSIYFPWDEVAEDRYKHLDFAKKSHADWLNFISRYVAATSREPRRDPDKDNRNGPDSEYWKDSLIE